MHQDRCQGHCTNELRLGGVNPCANCHPLAAACTCISALKTCPVVCNHQKLVILQGCNSPSGAWAITGTDVATILILPRTRSTNGTGELSGTWKKSQGPYLITREADKQTTFANRSRLQVHQWGVELGRGEPRRELATPHSNQTQTVHGRIVCRRGQTHANTRRLTAIASPSSHVAETRDNRPDGLGVCLCDRGDKLCWTVDCGILISRGRRVDRK